MYTDEKYIKIYSCCIPIKGAMRSSICDIQRQTIRIIPNSLFDFIQLLDHYSIGELKVHYGTQNHDIISEFISFLSDNKYAFFCNGSDLLNFPEIDLKSFHFPYKISNAIVELADVNLAEFSRILLQLNDVNCQAIEIRISTVISLELFNEILCLFSDISILEINIVLIDDGYSFKDLKVYFNMHARLKSIVIGGSDKEEFHSEFYDSNSFITFTKNKVYLPQSCGIFSLNSFVINIPFFSESQSYNTCLNKKVAIDRDGYIKNCPSMKDSFGNIKHNNLKDIVNNSKFTEKWLINKDQIKVCKDCEYRYVCMDCRAYLEKPNDLYSKPLKCGYDPYSCIWEEWSTNPLKKEAIIDYKL